MSAARIDFMMGLRMRFGLLSMLGGAGRQNAIAISLWPARSPPSGKPERFSQLRKAKRDCRFTHSLPFPLKSVRFALT